MKNDILKTQSFEIIAKDAINTISELWDKENQTFWRSNAQRTRDKDKNEFYPTVTFRCLEALQEVGQENPTWLNLSVDECFEPALGKLLNLELEKLKSSLNEEKNKNELNEFTLVIYIQTLCKFVNAEYAKSKKQDLEKIINDSLEVLLGHDKLKEIKSLHPFILYHISKALNSVLELNMKNDIIKIKDILEEIKIRAKEITENILAKDRLTILTPSDTVALAFCVGTLSENNFLSKEYLVASIDACLNEQDPNGCWPLGRILHRDKDIEKPFLEISTHEISWVITETAIDLLRKYGISHNHDIIKKTFTHLNKSLAYIEKTSIQLQINGNTITGWCSDCPYDTLMVESWTSAIVLKFINSFCVLDFEFKQKNILETFNTSYQFSKEFPNWLKWENFKNESEVDHKNPILKYIDEQIIRKIDENPQKLPTSEDLTVSALLFGPPGTSKTSIVKSVAQGLNWPLVSLNPGTFIMGGMEGIERIALDVFERLLTLKRVVVLFDECDELFRLRKPMEESDQTRNITAFITACMLPKLQDLHDKGKVLFFICTNNFEFIDAAVKRGGRIDHLIAVGPPDERARENIVNSTIKKLNISVKFEKEFINEISLRTERFTRSELIRLLKLTLEKTPGWKNVEDMKDDVKKCVAKYQNSLIIRLEDFTKFNEQKNEFSHPHMEV